MRRLPHRAIAAAFLLYLALCATTAAAAPPPLAPAAGDDVLQYLNSTIDWYRQVASLDQSQVTSDEIVFRDASRRVAGQVVRDAFAYARARAAVLAAADKPTSAAGPDGGRAKRLADASAAAALRVTALHAEIDRLAGEIAKATEADAAGLIARRDKLLAQLKLADARRDVLQSFAGFMSGPDNAAADGLLQKIADLEQSVPEAQSQETAPPPAAAPANASAAAASAVAAQAFHPESAGILTLVTELFTFTGRMTELHQLADATEQLAQANGKLRAPIRNELGDAVRKGDALAATTRSADDPQALAAESAQIDALATHFKELSAAAVPLGEEGVHLESGRGNLLEWRTAVGRQYHRVVRALLIRLAAIAGTILVLLVLSKLWGRATFRYVHDPRRRQQFLLVRRIVMGCIIVFVVTASVVSEFGSLATFAGIITAGIAVALQSVILSAVAYFFFIGRYGVRVGDRVTLGGITGDVIDVGVFRLYLMELSGTGRDQNATGRVVVFSNAVLFQPTGFFKQLPGADYAWHEIALTLSPESDYKLAEGRLLGAVESVFAEYRAIIERQYESAKSSIRLPMLPPRPEGRLRFVDAGLECVVRYPVEIARAAEIDDKITRKLVETIGEEPKLKLVASGTPRIQPAGGR